MRARWLVALLGACSVPTLSLDGKQCPCVESGYVCNTQTNTCVPVNDSGMIIDSPAATPCLAPVAETELYRYMGNFDWQHADPGWSGAAEIMQSSTTAMDTYAYKTSSDLTATANYHVISSMRQLQRGSGTPEIGIVLRAQLSPQDKQRYACTWSTKNSTLQVQVLGNNPMTLGTKAIPSMIAQPTTFTMEASVTGSTIACCIREIEDAKIVNAVDAGNVAPTGYPGLTTTRMQAAFGSFVVLRPN